MVWNHLQVATTRFNSLLLLSVHKLATLQPQDADPRGQFHPGILSALVLFDPFRQNPWSDKIRYQTRGGGVHWLRPMNNHVMKFRVSVRNGCSRNPNFNVLATLRRKPNGSPISPTRTPAGRIGIVSAH